MRPWPWLDWQDFSRDYRSWTYKGRRAFNGFIGAVVFVVCYSAWEAIRVGGSVVGFGRMNHITLLIGKDPVACSLRIPGLFIAEATARPIEEHVQFEGIATEFDGDVLLRASRCNIKATAEPLGPGPFDAHLLRLSWDRIEGGRHKVKVVLCDRIPPITHATFDESGVTLHEKPVFEEFAG